MNISFSKDHHTRIDKQFNMNMSKNIAMTKISFKIHIKTKHTYKFKHQLYIILFAKIITRTFDNCKKINKEKQMNFHITKKLPAKCPSFIILAQSKKKRIYYDLANKIKHATQQSIQLISQTTQIFFIYFSSPIKMFIFCKYNYQNRIHFF